MTALKATGKPLVLVLMNGRPLALVKEDQQADAILETWFAGTEGGNAIADVLFGDYNPSGKLPISFRVRWDKFRSITAISIRDARIILKSQTNTPHVILTKRMARSIRLVTV
nr:glycoside hydrolase family 3 C-terminal domain-containing protein [Salmonella enterica]